MTLQATSAKNSFVQSINYTLKHLAHQPESLCPRKNSRMFAEVSFKIKETWNPPRCPPADGWSVLHHRTEYYSVPERNELPNPRRHGWILNAFIYVAYDSNSILETIAYIYLNKWLYKTLRIWWEPEGRTGYVKTEDILKLMKVSCLQVCYCEPVMVCVY